MHCTDGEIQKGEGDVRNGLGEFEDWVEHVNEVDSLLKLLTGARGSTDAVINIVEKEMRDGAGVVMEEGLFHESYKETGIAQAHASAHRHPFWFSEVGGNKGKIVEGEDQFSQA
eukprot:g36445.t1